MTRRYDRERDRMSEELESITSAHEGKLTAELVVEYAKAHKKSAIYASFPTYIWDDKSAAEQHRLQIARNIIRAHVVIAPSGEERRAYFHVKHSGDEQYYVDVRNVAKEDQLTWLAMKQGLDAKLISLQQSIKEFEAWAGESGDDELVAKLGAISQSLGVAVAIARSLRSGPSEPAAH